MISQASAGLRWTALTVADSAALVALRPHLTQLRRVGAPGRWVAADGADTVAATLVGAALWLAAAWLAIGLLATAIGAVPGDLGRRAQRVAATVLPRWAYRLVAGAVGATVALTPSAICVAATAARGGDQPSSPPTAVVAPGWPTDDPLPSPRWPTEAQPSPSALPAPQVHVRHARRPERVRVEPGDTLWSIAADHLPVNAPAQRVAAQWPRWYRANRVLIGPDPNLIRPGEVLHRPEEGNRS